MKTQVFTVTKKNKDVAFEEFMYMSCVMLITTTTEDALPETNMFTENGWLEDDPSEFGGQFGPMFRGFCC